MPCFPSVYPSRFCNLESAREKFGDRVDRLGAFFAKTDPLADAVVFLPELHEQIDEALKSGSKPSHHPAIRALVESIEAVPAWVDWPTLDRGGELLLRSGWFGGMVLGLLSLPLGYASPGGNKPLVLSGQLTQQAGRRLAETARFVHAVAQPGSMKPGGEGLAISVKVRLIHAFVRRQAWDSKRWDSKAWGEPINQHDLAATTLLFSLAVIEGLRKCGLAIDRDEADDCIQLWRYVGHVLGADAELLPASEPEARRLADLVAATQAPPDDDSRALMHALLEHARNDAASPTLRKRAERMRPIALGLCRDLLGEDLADKLAVPHGSRLATPALRALVRAAESVRLRSDTAHAIAIRQGNRYWLRVLELGLGDTPAEFRPKNLA